MKIDLLLESSKFTKLRRYLHSLVEHKETKKGILIATPMNPQGGAASKKKYDKLSDAEKQEYNKENNDLYKEAEKELKDKGFHFYKQKGVFEGQSEKSFIIFDITKGQANALGKKWDQSAIVYIHAAKTRKKGEYMLKFELIETSKKVGKMKILSMVSNMFSAGDSIKNDFSQVGSNKYVIPFFDDMEHALAAYKKEEGTKNTAIFYMDNLGKLNKLKPVIKG